MAICAFVLGPDTRPTGHLHCTCIASNICLLLSSKLCNLRSSNKGLTSPTSVIVQSNTHHRVAWRHRAASKKRTLGRSISFRERRVSGGRALTYTNTSMFRIDAISTRFIETQTFYSAVVLRARFARSHNKIESDAKGFIRDIDTNKLQRTQVISSDTSKRTKREDFRRTLASLPGSRY